MRKRLCALMMTLVLPLSACGGATGESGAETMALDVRAKYLEMTACAGHMELTADYGQRVYTYGVDVTWAREGETLLTLTSPESVAGLTAHISQGETALEYDGVMVETGELNADGLTPVDAVPALLAYAQEGFMAECVLEDWDGEERLHVTCRDPEKDPGQGTEAQLWFQPDTAALVRGEISSDGFTVIVCEVSGFTMSGPAA